MKKAMGFEEYLMFAHAEQYEGLKDSIVDDCADWMGDLGVDDLIEYAEIWHKQEGEK